MDLRVAQAAGGAQHPRADPKDRDGGPIAQGGSGNDAEHFTGVDRLAFFDVKALDRAAFWRANFVLHFHGFDNQEALARFDSVPCLDENTDDLARHGSEDLLAALGFACTVPTAAPGAGIDNFGGKLLETCLKLEDSVGGLRDVNFVGLAFEKKRECVGIDVDGVGLDLLAVQQDLPAIRIALEFNGAELLTGWASELHFKPHGRRSSCWRRPSCFQRDGGEESRPEDAWPEDFSA